MLYSSNKKQTLPAYTIVFETHDSLVEETYVLPTKADQKAKMEQQLQNCSTSLEKRDAFVSNGALLMNTLEAADGRQRPAVIEFSKSGKVKNCYSYEHGVFSAYGQNPYNICAFNFSTEYNTGKKGRANAAVFTIATVSTLSKPAINHRSKLIKEATNFEMRKYLFDRNIPMTNYLKSLTPKQEGPTNGHCSKREANRCDPCYRMQYFGS